MKRSWAKGWPGRRGVGGLRDGLIQPYFLTDAGRMWKEQRKGQRKRENAMMRGAGGGEEKGKQGQIRR